MTPTQRRILWLMVTLDEQFVACTGEGARLEGFGHWLPPEGGLAVRSYSDPLYFMSGHPKRWLEPVERNARGRWYRITEAGRAAAAKIKTEPPVPKRNPTSTFGAF